MTTKISGAEYPLAKIFGSDFDYHIPPYQRPYAWTVDEAGILFDDLNDFFLTEEQDSYFLGSIVLIKKTDHPWADVIDGQQRLVTLTILLANLASRFQGEEQAGFRTFIWEPGNRITEIPERPRLHLGGADEILDTL